MFLLAVLAYFLLVCAALALIALPAARAQVRVRLGDLRHQGRAWLLLAATRGCRCANAAVAPVVDGVRQATVWAAAYRWHVGAAVLLLALAPGSALVWRQRHAFDGYDDTASHDVDPRIAGLLSGEQLVPPPALPPDWFMTAEVEQAHPMAGGASRQWELLDAEFRQRVLAVFQLMHKQHGYDMVLIEGYRSPQRQAQLAAMGASVTLAAADQSYHQYGLAADCAFLRNGHIVISERDPWAARAYEVYGQVAASVGLNWGGQWRRLKDLGHIELQRPHVLGRR